MTSDAPAWRAQQSGWMRLSPFLVCVAVLGVSRVEAAKPQRDEFKLDVTAGTSFPIDVHVRAGLELPGRILLSSSLGYMPPLYVDALNAVLLGLNVYNQATADIVASSLRTSLVWRSHLGWRPFPKSGFNVQAGYTLITLGGGVTAAAAIWAATGRVVDEALIGGVDIEASSRLHQISGEVGWQWWPKPLTLAVAIGGFGTVDAWTRLTPRGGAAAPLLTPVTQAGEVYLNDAYRSYVHGVMLSARIGFALL